MMTNLSDTASLWRRLAAMLYDSFLILAIVFITGLVIVPLSPGLAASDAFTILLYLEVFAFYAYFWHLRGQTLGMQVWKIKVVNDAGEILTYGECAVRFFFATLSLAFIGLGFLWILFDPERLAWHDRASGTRVIFLGKDAYSPGRQAD